MIIIAINILGILLYRTIFNTNFYGIKALYPIIFILLFLSPKTELIFILYIYIKEILCKILSMKKLHNTTCNKQ